MNIYPAHCPKCLVPLPSVMFNNPETTECPSCMTFTRADIFPAMYRRTPAIHGVEGTAGENEATCFYHPGKRAVIPCEVCGRFLCALCDIEFSGRHLCSVCIESGRKKRTIKNLENHRVLYDDIALALAIIPLVFIWPSLFTAPMSLYVAFRHWNSPSSIIPRSRLRFILTILLSGLQTAAWTGLFVWLLARFL